MGNLKTKIGWFCRHYQLGGVLGRLIRMGGILPWREGLTVFVLIALAYQWFLFSTDNATSAAIEGGQELGVG